MKYPVDVEKYVAAARLEHTVSASKEEVIRDVVPLMNDAYASGLRGDDWSGELPLEEEKFLREFAEYTGKPIEEVRKNKLIFPIISCVNDAYFEGRKEAEGVTEHG